MEAKAGQMLLKIFKYGFPQGVPWWKEHFDQNHPKLYENRVKWGYKFVRRISHSPNTPPPPPHLHLHKGGMRFFKNGCSRGMGNLEMGGSHK